MSTWWRPFAMSSHVRSRARRRPVRGEGDDAGDRTGWWDSVRLDQICRNLVSNAIRFGAGRPIEVAVEADESVATLPGAGYGIGIAPEQART